jgi:O-antigen ligase
MLHSLLEFANGRHHHRMGIIRLIGVDTTLGNPNSFGNSIVYTLPLVTPLWLARPSPRMKVFLLGYLGLAFMCIALTGSRSSFVGLVLWSMVTVVRSQWRLRMSVLAVVVAPLLWAALPPTLQNRFETIIDPEVGPANAQESGEGRIYGLMMGLELWARNPATGVGPGAFRPATGSLTEPHNLYGQLLGEMGTLGGLTFAAVLLAFWANLRAVKRTYRQNLEWEHDFLYHLPRAIGLAVLLLLFEGNFGHNLLRFNWLWYGGFLIIAHHCIQQRLRAQAEEYAWWPQATNWVACFRGPTS